MGEEKIRKQETKENEMIEIYNYMYKFESVCNSQNSKAFELAAAYLQVKKGTFLLKHL